ncbi:MAG TPA: lysine--tRNA ligase [Candidatus Bathyarchaeia archaeon]|nr:lysine--tRNA ligase [Candidatus Bathyarchaeia archaeon]
MKSNHNQENQGTEKKVHEAEEFRVRCAKMEKLRAQGIEPWPLAKQVTTTCAQIHTAFVENDEKEYMLAGRIVTIREHGKTIFVTMHDQSGALQLYVKSDIIGQEQFDIFKHDIDLGDVIWCAGHTFRTKMGEITLKVTAWTLLSKCLRPLPDKFHGIADIEIKYRHRYLDLMTNEESRERFVRRSQIIRAMRTYFYDHNWMEVETPMLHPIPGGAIARPFVTHHNALSMDLYLRIAPELYLKRLIIGGFERVFEINRSFRNEGISTKHNPEFTTVEYYIAHHDYHFMMTFTEHMIKYVTQQITGISRIMFGDRELNFDAPFARMTMQEAVAHYGDIAVTDLTPERIGTVVKAKKIDIPASASWGLMLNALFEHCVESALIQPTFITEFPVEVSPLAKKNPSNPLIVDRFELFIMGMELSNGFNELNDPFDQAERFKEQARQHAEGNKEAHYYDAEYIMALEYGLPPAVGAAIGIDRLTMLLTNAHSIRDVILFPTLKNK